MAFDFDAAVTAPFSMQPGLRRLPPGARQLTPLSPGSRHQREKLAVLSAFPSEALLVAPGFDPLPALHALCAHAAAEHPDAFAWKSSGASGAAAGPVAHALRLGTAVDGERVEQVEAGVFGLGDEVARCLRLLPANWRLAGLLSLAFAEDFAIVDGEDGRVPWIAAALPSHWAPEDKVGRRLDAIHAPVADGERVTAAAPALARLVTAGERWERFVWTVTPHPRLHAHPRRVDPDGWKLTPIERAWWRTERQTFVPVPGRRQAVFTIGVEVQPLAAVLQVPGRAATLHAAIASMSPEVLAYRGLDAVRAPLLAWLAAQP